MFAVLARTTRVAAPREKLLAPSLFQFCEQLLEVIPRPQRVEVRVLLEMGDAGWQVEITSCLGLFQQVESLDSVLLCQLVPVRLGKLGILTDDSRRKGTRAGKV